MQNTDFCVILRKELFQRFLYADQHCFFYDIAQELKLHMDPDGRAGEFVKRRWSHLWLYAKLEEGHS